MISREEFLRLSTEEVARLARAAGPQVCVFPINGTRRWFMLEYGDQDWDDPLAAYLDIASQNHIALYRLVFDHGLDTLLTPTLGPDILLRGEEYMQRIGAAGLERLARHPMFRAFYEEYDVRVRFYGDYRRRLAGTPYAYLADIFDEAAEQTKSHRRCRLFFGVFGNDPAEAVAELAVRHHQVHGQIPDRRTLVELYYGEYVPPATLFIGFDKFSAFDYPLLNLGEENLYFTVAPSPYLDETQLRLILHDHLFTRQASEPDYAEMPAPAREFMRQYYQAHRSRVAGVGSLHGGIWYPQEFDKDEGQ